MSGDYTYGISCHDCGKVLKKSCWDMTEENKEKNLPHVDISVFCQESFYCEDCDKTFDTPDEYSIVLELD